MKRLSALFFFDPLRTPARLGRPASRHAASPPRPPIATPGGAEGGLAAPGGGRSPGRGAPGGRGTPASPPLPPPPPVPLHPLPARALDQKMKTNKKRTRAGTPRAGAATVAVRRAPATGRVREARRAKAMVVGGGGARRGGGRVTERKWEWGGLAGPRPALSAHTAESSREEASTIASLSLSLSLLRTRPRGPSPPRVQPAQTAHHPCPVEARAAHTTRAEGTKQSKKQNLPASLSFSTSPP